MTQSDPQTTSLSNPFRTRILSGQITPLLTAKYLTTNELPLLCKTTSIHAIFIDMEHSAHDMRTVSQLILACHCAGISPVVRSPSKSHFHISRILDAGASAVVIPHVESVEEVKELVQHGKYAPMGKRGCTNNQPAFGFRHVSTKVQNAVLNEQTMLIPMIETPGAVDIVEEIVAVEGVDGILVGSNDLCSDMGIPGGYDTAEYQDAVKRVIKACVDVGKPVGIGGIPGRMDLLEMWFKLGATWSLGGQDGAMVQAGMRQLSQKYEDINMRLERV